MSVIGEMALFVYRCPNTGLNVQGFDVQGFAADDPTKEDDDSTFKAVTCTVCTRVHLVNPKTGKVAGSG